MPLSSELQTLIVERRIERVTADQGAAVRMLNAAHRHVASARLVCESDPEGAYGLLYDAVRKAIGAHMEANGLRAVGQGAHRSVLTYAESQLAGLVPGSVLADLDRMRITRNNTEYAARSVSPDEARHDLKTAEELVRVVRGYLRSR